MRQRLCKVCRDWHDLNNWPSECYVIQERKRADFPLPMVFSTDSTEPLRSMADGQIYTSKAAMRASYKASNNPQGENYMEVGNETRNAPKIDRNADRKGIREAIERAQADIAAGRPPQIPSQTGQHP